MPRTWDESWDEWGPLPLRLMLFISFMYHGLPKLFWGHEGAVGMFTKIGIPAPELAVWVVGIVEVVGAILLLVGAFVTITSIILIINMLVALFTVHLPAGFSFINRIGMENGMPDFGIPGYEVNLLFIAMLLALAIGGAGAWSIDRSRADEDEWGGDDYATAPPPPERAPRTEA